jgi:hypothetical protein
MDLNGKAIPIGKLNNGDGTHVSYLPPLACYVVKAENSQA